MLKNWQIRSHLQQLTEPP
uniref:Uncharacterized protein n=1 Tax=Arundo donax TaxID=35708 RepID=A0A0A8YKC1_ARUDO